MTLILQCEQCCFVLLQYQNFSYSTTHNVQSAFKHQPVSSKEATFFLCSLHKNGGECYTATPCTHLHVWAQIKICLYTNVPTFTIYWHNVPLKKKALLHKICLQSLSLGWDSNWANVRVHCDTNTCGMINALTTDYSPTQAAQTKPISWQGQN